MLLDYVEYELLLSPFIHFRRQMRKMQCRSWDGTCINLQAQTTIGALSNIYLHLLVRFQWQCRDTMMLYGWCLSLRMFDFRRIYSDILVTTFSNFQRCQIVAFYGIIRWHPSIIIESSQSICYCSLLLTTVCVS